MTRHPQARTTRRPTRSKPRLIDFGLITAIDVERKAVCQAFGLAYKHRVRRDARVYWRGSVALAKGESYEIVVAQPPDMAQVDAAILTNDMIHHWNPRALLLVGVAGSASDGSGKDEPRLGDLVVARDVYYYERGKVTAQGKAPEPTIYRADPVLLNNVINMPPMTSRIAVARPDGRDVRPVVHQGVIASGEKVIADAAARDVIARDHRKISAIEMEGYGFSAAVWQSAGSHRHLVMKAICDRADRDKTQDWQPYAAAVAARYARHFLRDRPLEPHAPREKAGGARGTTATLNHPRPAASELQASEDPSTHLPPKAYHELIGRQSEIGRITRALQGSQDVIVVVGLGGIGKTALVREVAARCLEHQSFKGIVWTSFKSELFVGERVTEIERLEFSFDEVLGEILRQHAAQIREDDKKRQKPGADISALTTDQRLTAVTQALKKHRILIVLDNLETVPDGEELVARLSAISGHGKLLITSRHKLKLDAFNLELSGLTEQEGVAFLRKESQARGIEAVSGATRSALVTIHHVTGGAPLAMKLVIGQMSRQPMVAVLETLKSATFRGEDYEFYSFIYRYSWQNLEQPARMALVDMSVFADKGGAIEDVQSISQVKGDDFWRAMDQLVRLSLVEKTGKAGAERFALHPLTKNFVRSDITKEWGRGKEHASRR